MRYPLWMSLALSACMSQAPQSGTTSGTVGGNVDSSGAGSQQTGVEEVGSVPGSAAEPATRSALTVAEWGTFTSVMGCDGVPLPGLHIEEEGLPPFVHGRCSDGPVCLAIGDKDLEGLPGVVTQKLETPVLFFYSDVPRTVRVTVDFPDGLISQYFPRAFSFAPAVGQLEDVADGAMSWEVQLDPQIPLESFPWVPEDDIWAPSRAVPATPLRVGDEHERFIFYRGLGRFTPPVRVTSVGSVATFHNDSAEPVAAAFHLTRDDAGRGSWVALGAVAAGAAVTFETERMGRTDYLDGARAELTRALVTSGLSEAEAKSMVETWSHSYFGQSGSRVLYVVPRSWTDALLPIAIEPAPDRLVRTLVGRVELLSQREEEVWSTRFGAAWQDEGRRYEALDAVHRELGRFAAPYLFRLAKLAEQRGEVDLAGWLMARHDEACRARF